MKTQNWRQLATVQAGGAICLPVFIIGQTLSQNYGFLPAIAAIITGNLLLLVMAVIMAYTGTREKKSTAEVAIEVFGPKGRFLFAGCIIFSLLGWFAIQTHIMGMSLSELLGLPPTIMIVSIGIFITLLGLRGLKGVTILADLSMPLLIFTIGYALFKSSQNPQVSHLSYPFTMSGISLVLACAIAGVIDLPTFFRASRSTKDTLIAVSILFGVVLPVLESVGVFLQTYSQGENLLDVLSDQSSSQLWRIWVALFLLLAGWTTNNTNIYSASVNMRTIVKFSEKKNTLLIGLLGTALATLNIEKYMLFILDSIGILLCSMGAVILGHYIEAYFLRRYDTQNNILCWLMGVMIGFSGLTISGINTLDAFIIAFALRALIILIPKKEIIEWNN